MGEAPGIFRLHGAEGEVALLSWSATPAPSEATGRSDHDVSLTEPASVSLAFGQCDAVVAQQGRTRVLEMAPGDITLCGPEPLQWLGASGSGPGEFIEITADPRLRRAVADEFLTSASADLDVVPGWKDPVVWAIASQFRSAALGTIHVNDLERDFLMRRLYGRVLEVQFGGRGSARGYGALDVARLRRVLEFVDAHLEEHLTIETLSQVAALSSFHFVRAFRQSCGLTPHRYVRARRLERARRLLASGQSVRAVARLIGYQSISHFRSAYHAQFGTTCDGADGRGRRR